jgi:formylglycine-generating enzyme required for sulfatase activity
MIGNVWEWTSSVYRNNPFQSDDGIEDPTSRKVRAARGGSWYYSPQSLRVSVRGFYSPAGRNNNIGFRCARDGSP